MMGVGGRCCFRWLERLLLIIFLFTYVSDIWYLVPALLASADGIALELLDAGVTLANVDVEVDTPEGDTVDCWMGDKGDDWLMDTGEGISVGNVMIVG